MISSNIFRPFFRFAPREQSSGMRKKDCERRKKKKHNRSCLLLSLGSEGGREKVAAREFFHLEDFDPIAPPNQDTSDWAPLSRPPLDII